MPDCDYCDSHVDESAGDGEQPYLAHLAEQHPDEVSRVDERKLEKEWDGDLEKARAEDYRFSARTLGISAAIIVLIAGLGAVGVMGGSSNSDDAGSEGTEWIYEKGGMSVQVDGEKVSPSELGGSEYFYVDNETSQWRMSVPSDYRYTVADGLVALGLIESPDPPVRFRSEYVGNASDIQMTVAVDGEQAKLNDTIQQGQNISVTVETKSESD